MSRWFCVSLQRKRHYWRLDTKTLTLFQNQSGAKFYKVGDRVEQNRIEPDRLSDGHRVGFLDGSGIFCEQN